MCRWHITSLLMLYLSLVWGRMHCTALPPRKQYISDNGMSHLQLFAFVDGQGRGRYMQLFIFLLILLNAAMFVVRSAEGSCRNPSCL